MAELELALRPRLAVVDPDLSATQPAGVTAAAGMDILCHALESYTARWYADFDAKSPEQRVPYCGSNPIADLWSERALGLLVRREHSQRELTRKLTARGVAVDDAKAAVDKLREAGWQDDARFAQSLARMRATSGYGPVRIRAELETHELDAHAIAQAFEALADAGEDDWLNQAHLLVQRRYGADCAADPTLRRKAVDFLIRRGFDATTAHAAVRPTD